MKNFLLTILSFSFSIFLYAQSLGDAKRDYNWCLGYWGNYWGNDSIPLNRIVINFHNGTAEANANYIYMCPDIEGANASISDSMGNLLFYTNGYHVYNRLHQTMENGDSIGCCSDIFDGFYVNPGCDVNLQGVLILPKNISQYYIIHQLAQSSSGNPTIIFPKLLYTLVDMSYNGGLGKVIEKNTPFLAIGNLMQGNLTACRHANGRDWWLLANEMNTNHFYRFLISPSGIQLVGTQNIGENRPNTLGQSNFTPNGKKFVTWGINDYNINGAILHIFDFDRCTGLLSNPLSEHYFGSDLDLGTGGSAISPNSRYLYCNFPCCSYQYDLDAVDVLASRQLVAAYDGFTDNFAGIQQPTIFMWSQLAPDGKIYMATGNTHYLTVIENPDSGGVACNVNQHSFYLGRLNGQSIPNFPNFRLGPLVGSACDTLVSIKEQGIVNKQYVQIYPNPAKEILTIQYSKTTGMLPLFTVYNPLGQKIWEKAVVSGEKIDIQHWEKGIYYYQITYENAPTYYGKLLVEP